MQTALTILMSALIILSRLVAFAFIDFLMIVPFALLGIFHLVFRRSIIKGNTLVVLIHGSGVNDWQWGVAKFFLDLHGLSFISVNYDYNLPIHKCTQNVKAQLPKNKSIILIGHSLGGLVARAIVNDVNAKAIFLLNTPQKGAVILDWIYPIKKKYDCSENDMRPESDFLKNLPKIDSKTTIYEIVGLNDYVRSDHCISFGKNVYESWFGHYFSAVNPYLWLNWIIPRINNYIDR
jgi:triacylglycerol esterase/lipase EstA (alpha/beta hydrolase family)